MNNPEIQSILEYWFAQLDEQGVSHPDQQALWFKSNPETDEHCSVQFGELVEQAIGGELDSWAESDEGLIALVLLLDQLPRNIYRGAAKAFSGDPRALELAQTSVDSGRHLHLPAIHRLFLYLPFEHSEDLVDQERSVELVSALAQENDNPMFPGFVRYAIAHRDVIAQFGRFPHRNAILGRESGEEELRYLQTHGGF